MKALFGKINAPESGLRNKTLGSSSGNFTKAVLPPKTIAIIKLSCHVFGHLDRQSISVMERQLNLVADQKKRVAKQVSDFINRPESLSEIHKGMKSAKISGHSCSYEIFERLCVVSADAARFDSSTLKRLGRVGKQIGLAEAEILSLIKKTKLAE